MSRVLHLLPAAAIVAGLAACAGAMSGAAAGQQDPAVADFLERVDKYVALHKKLEATLPTLSKNADPTELDRHERALGKLMRGARGNARQGDLITPAMGRHMRHLIRQVFKGPAGREIRASIEDENPGDVPVRVNARYPDAVPLSTVPPQVLLALPKLPEELEYRFIGERLILLDVHAHLIADYADNVF